MIVAEPYVDDKYVIFKREDWSRWESDPDVKAAMGAAAMNFRQLHALKDAVVIRLHDVLAAPALAAYAGATGAFLDAMRLLAPEDVSQEIWEPHAARYNRLLDIRELFLALARRAEEHPGRKVPD